jgi:hypothetical protein
MLVPGERDVTQPKQDRSSSVRNSRSAEKIDASAGVDVAGAKVAFSSTVKLLGVTLDENMSLDRHVADIVRGCSYHTRALRHIRPLINLSTARMVAQGVVMS